MQHRQNNALIPLLPKVLTFMWEAVWPSDTVERVGARHVTLSKLLKLPQPHYRTVRTQSVHRTRLSPCLANTISHVGVSIIKRDCSRSVALMPSHSENSRSPCYYLLQGNFCGISRTLSFSSRGVRRGGWQDLICALSCRTHFTSKGFRSAQSGYRQEAYRKMLVSGCIRQDTNWHKWSFLHASLLQPCIYSHTGQRTIEGSCTVYLCAVSWL